jgi:hypothetical protein
MIRMDEAVLHGMARWPDVPAVYGWLALDARGNWRLRNPARGAFERIGHPELRAFIAHNYAPDAEGRWFFQNGPQRVFVRLERAPLVLRLGPQGACDHCGREAGEPAGAWLDEEGALYFELARGLAVLDDRDLLALADEVDAGEVWIGATRLQVRRVARSALGERFGFVPDPRP